MTLILSNGKRIEDVVLAWASEKVKVGGREVPEAVDLEFSLSEIVDIAPGS